MSANQIISVGWPTPKNVTFTKKTDRKQQLAVFNWDNINYDVSPFTLDNSGGSINPKFNKVSYKITQISKLLKKNYDSEGRYFVTEINESEVTFDVFNSSFTLLLSPAVNKKICIKIQAVYDISNTPFLYNDLVISDKTNEICLIPLLDKYCASESDMCQDKTVNTAQFTSSKMRYSKAIRDVNSSSSFFSNYARGFMKL